MFKENQKLIFNDTKYNRRVNCKFREPYGENCSLVYLYTKDWKSFGRKLVNNIDLEEFKEEQMKENVYEAEQKCGQRKVNRSFIVHLLMSFSDEGTIDISKEQAEKITMLIENDYEYEFYVEYLPHKGIVEFLEDFDLL